MRHLRVPVSPSGVGVAVPLAGNLVLALSKPQFIPLFLSIGLPAHKRCDAVLDFIMNNGGLSSATASSACSGVALSNGFCSLAARARHAKCRLFPGSCSRNSPSQMAAVRKKWPAGSTWQQHQRQVLFTPAATLRNKYGVGSPCLRKLCAKCDSSLTNSTCLLAVLSRECRGSRWRRGL